MNIMRKWFRLRNYLPVKIDHKLQKRLCDLDYDRYDLAQLKQKRADDCSWIVLLACAFWAVIAGFCFLDSFGVEDLGTSYGFRLRPLNFDGLDWMILVAMTIGFIAFEFLVIYDLAAINSGIAAAKKTAKSTDSN